MSVAKEKLAYSAHDWSEKSFVMKLKGLVYVLVRTYRWSSLCGAEQVPLIG